MAGKLLVASKFKRPADKPLKEVLGKKTKSREIDKRYTAVKLADENGSFDLGPMAPTDEQLAKINRFTRTPKSADDVAVLPTLACNDIVDRDFDQFTKEAIEGFASLPDGLNPVGKSFMVGHDYTKLPIGRIFDQEVVEIEGDTFLKLYNYIPNTEANKSYLENVDFGVYWAVSVGVVLEEAKCPIGKEHEWGWSFFNSVCSEGHIKGYNYDPDSEEEDALGWPIPVQEGADGAQLCYRALSAPKDFYELSQVYLGAQYQAELSEKKPFAGIIKAASQGKHPRPVISLTEKEAEELPMPEDEALQKAMRAHKVTHDDNGNINWSDEDGLVWMYEESKGEVLCLGKAITEEEVEEEEETESLSEEDEDTVESSAEEESDEDEEEEEESEEPVASADSTEEDEDNEDEGEGKVAKTASVTVDVIDTPQYKDLLKQNKDLTKQVEKLTAKADLGEQFIKEVKAEALTWYVKAHATKEQPAVKTEMFQRILDGLGDNVDLIKELTNEQKSMAQAKFPQKVRRSSFESNPQEREELAPPIDTSSVSKIHK